jgi:hypothetical protein
MVLTLIWDGILWSAADIRYSSTDSHLRVLVKLHGQVHLAHHAKRTRRPVMSAKPHLLSV